MRCPSTVERFSCLQVVSRILQAVRNDFHRGSSVSNDVGHAGDDEAVAAVVAFV